MNRLKLDKKSQKINSPLASYSTGKLQCIVCNTIIKSENLWLAHLHSSSHTKNLNKLKKRKVEASSSEGDNSTKKAKLNDVGAAVKNDKSSPVKKFNTENEKSSIEVSSDEDDEQDETSDLPPGFFDNSTKLQKDESNELENIPKKIENINEIDLKLDNFLSELKSEEKQSEVALNTDIELKELSKKEEEEELMLELEREFVNENLDQEFFEARIKNLKSTNEFFQKLEQDVSQSKKYELEKIKKIKKLKIKNKLRDLIEGLGEEALTEENEEDIWRI
ncbi:hypothetical protein HK099_001851 [Clydaea vesicula]|uniref:U1-type domain-containing protein n=1 Tax=Clydaea vesicula TaxID=447962 RepID=A0AAD5U660_9FUNG|nr:hypothetical protein HK099_001851 [Clydaea vesicula]KAJ3381605.1 hypothetical protein HDU92_005237 [Lobulomyces angularis]